MKSRIGYSKPSCRTTWHKARHHSLRDVEIYQMLADDIKSGRNEYVDSKSLSDLYEEKVGAKSPIHRYHVLRSDEPSTTIISHLDRDGNRKLEAYTGIAISMFHLQCLQNLCHLFFCQISGCLAKLFCIHWFNLKSLSIHNIPEHLLLFLCHIRVSGR